MCNGKQHKIHRQICINHNSHTEQLNVVSFLVLTVYSDKYYACISVVKSTPSTNICDPDRASRCNENDTHHKNCKRIWSSRDRPHDHADPQETKGSYMCVA